MGFKKIWEQIKGAVRKVARRATQKKKAGSKAKRLPKTKAPELLPAPVVESMPQIPVFSAIDEFAGVQLSTHTQRAYQKDLRDYFSYLKQQGIWEGWAQQVTPIVVAQFRMHLSRERGLAKGSVTRKLAVVKSFYRWARSRGWVRDNPAELIRSFPQTQESKTGFLTDHEVEGLLSHVDHANGDERLSFHLARVVIETLLMLGVRRSEAAAVRIQDLEYSEQRWVVRIRGKGDRDRSLPVPPRLLDTWAEWLRRLSDEAPSSGFEESPGSWLDWCQRNATQPLFISSRSRDFQTSLSSSEIARIVRKSARRAGLVHRVSPHMLRATAITHALDQGASHRGVQQMAGWTSPLMISRYDKRRKDPQFSAIHQLLYARKKVQDTPDA